MLATDRSLGAGVFGDGLGAFTDGVLGEFTGQQEPHGSLHLPGRDGGPLVVVGEAGSFGGDTLEDVVHERVHDGHGLAGDTGVGVHLFQHLVDVDGVTLLPLMLLLLFVGLGDVLLGFARLLGGFSTCLGRHYEIVEYTRATETEFSRSITCPNPQQSYLLTRSRAHGRGESSSDSKRRRTNRSAPKPGEGTPGRGVKGPR